MTEAFTGAPVLSSMEVVEISKTEDGVPVYIDKNASQADWIIVTNRIKPHTKFKAPIESGLMKMMAIGMGKQKGAEYYHKAAIHYHLPQNHCRCREGSYQEGPHPLRAGDGGKRL